VIGIQEQAFETILPPRLREEKCVATLHPGHSNELCLRATKAREQASRPTQLLVCCCSRSSDPSSLTHSPRTTVVSIRSASDRLETRRVDALFHCPSGEFLGVWIPRPGERAQRGRRHDGPAVTSDVPTIIVQLEVGVGQLHGYVGVDPTFVSPAAICLFLANREHLLLKAEPTNERIRYMLSLDRHHSSFVPASASCRSCSTACSRSLPLRFLYRMIPLWSIT
jgi:hypothetical protein